MIYFLFGENLYERDQALVTLLGDRSPENFDGETLSVNDLPNIFMGATLFSSERTIVVKYASENAALWAKIDEYLEKVPAETTLFFIETKPDKRTKTFKDLKKLAETREFLPLKNTAEAMRFVQEEAKKRQLSLGSGEARQIVSRAGLDTLVLVRALEKVALLEMISAPAIAAIIDENSETKIFGLFQAALSQNATLVHGEIAKLSATENPHQTMGFLASQALQLAALQANDDSKTVAKQLGAHPFALEKLAPFARTMSAHDVHNAVRVLAECDVAMKTSGGEPWLLIETALQTIATRP